MLRELSYDEISNLDFDEAKQKFVEIIEQDENCEELANVVASDEWRNSHNWQRKDGEINLEFGNTFLAVINIKKVLVEVEKNKENCDKIEDLLERLKAIKGWENNGSDEQMVALTWNLFGSSQTYQEKIDSLISELENMKESGEEKSDNDSSQDKISLGENGKDSQEEIRSEEEEENENSQADDSEERTSEDEKNKENNSSEERNNSDAKNIESKNNENEEDKKILKENNQ